VFVVKRLIGGVICGALLVTLGACGYPTKQRTKVVTGRVAIDGSAAMAAFNLRAKRSFMELTGDTNTPLTVSGNSAAFAKLCSGEIDVAAVSRPINTSSEAPLCRKNGITPHRILIAYEAAVVVANKALAIGCLKTSQLTKLWRRNSEVSSYAQLGGGLPAVEVSLFGPTKTSPVFELFTSAINGEAGNSRSDYSPFLFQKAEAFAAAITADKAALGYFDYAALEEQLQANSVLGVDAGDGCVKPSLATIQSGSYSPLSRPLYYYFDLKQITTESAVSTFLEISMANAAMFAKANSLVPITPNQITQERVRWLKAIESYKQSAG
jgi:phosphate transport system substrate-binding protein